MKKRYSFACLLAVLSVLLSGCAGIRQATNADERITVEFIAKTKSGDYWSTVKAGADAAAKEFNVNLNFTAPDYEHDIEEQIRLVSEVVERKSDALVLAAGDYAKLAGITEKAYEAKIPVIIVDSEVKTDRINSIISTDNRQAGIKAGERLIELTGKSARIAVMNFVKGARNAEQREEGLLSVLSQYRSVEIAAKEYTASDEKLAYEITKELLQRDRGINGIAALNALTSEGAAQAIEELGLAGKVKLVAFDCTPEEIEYLERGVIQSTIIQKPFNMGYLSVKYAAMAARGEKIPQSVDTGSIVIDKENMYLPENQKLVFPFVR